MDHFAGLDVSVKETSVCIVDDTGKVVPRHECVADPRACSQGSCAGSRPATRLRPAAGRPGFSTCTASSASQR
jgi:hypothetical protein